MSGGQVLLPLPLLEPLLAQGMYLAGPEAVGIDGVVVVDEPAQADGSEPGVRGLAGVSRTWQDSAGPGGTKEHGP
jgi:hypothetical protein